MCTAITFQADRLYFGRTLDYECSFGEEVTITPRRFPLPFRFMGESTVHYAMIGMASVADGYPLYYDAVNEKGLGIAGLNFVGNAVYTPTSQDKDNIPPFELIPWILGQCASVKEAKELLSRICLVNEPFSDALPLAQLHWLIADKTEAITLEAVADGIKIYDNPIGVLTNNPPFDKQLFRLNDYRALSPKTPPNNFCEALPTEAYSRGMGAIGLPGDLSSTSRFVREAFVKANAVSEKSGLAAVSQFFHVLGAVEQQEGCCEVAAGEYEKTIYTSCCDTLEGVYYYTTYDNHQISAVRMQPDMMEKDTLLQYPLLNEEQICCRN